MACANRARPCPPDGDLPVPCPRSPQRSGRPSRWAWLARRGARLAAPALVLVLALACPPAGSGASAHSPRTGAPTMLEPHTASLLVDYYDSFLRDHDIEAFRRSVVARYTQATLARLVEAGDTRTRRAAVLALGLVGDMEVNVVVGRALRDADPAVRSLADNALWAIWFRADTPENNATLERVRDLIQAQHLGSAVELATRLIERSPRFAEAYNQRAIALFFLRRYEESAADCVRVVELNPCHTGALSGLGQCYLRLKKRQEALKVYRRALRLQPFNEGLRELVAGLEAETD